MNALPTDSKQRKDIPLARGVLDYFPAALAAVAELSRAGNDKHNPGEPMHHARGKSTDHADCILRHMVDRGTIDPEDGILHDVKVVWRALAMLQEELERRGAPLARGAKLPNPFDGIDRSVAEPVDWSAQISIGEQLKEAIALIRNDVERAEYEAYSMPGSILTDADDPRMIPVIRSIKDIPETREAPNNIHERIAGDTPLARKIKNTYYGGTPLMAGTPVRCDDGWEGKVVEPPDAYGFVTVSWTLTDDARPANGFTTSVAEHRLEIL